jgi:diguanylate cyclase (GGDEF)-like protein
MVGAKIVFQIPMPWNIKSYVQRKLEFLASHDALTRIFNRYSFNTILKNETERSRRYKTPLSMIMLDIDHFKKVNDTYGHRIGDFVLRGVAKAVAARIRGNDMVFRVGGEEFVVLAVESDVDNAANLAGRLRKIIETTDFKEAGFLTISLGVAQYIPEESDESFFRRTDRVMYIAKNEGRNKVVVDHSHLADLAGSI